MKSTEITTIQAICLDQEISGPDSKPIAYINFLDSINVIEVEKLLHKKIGNLQITDNILSAFSKEPNIGIRHAGTYYSFYKTWHIQLLVNFILYPQVIHLLRKSSKDFTVSYSDGYNIVINFEIKDISDKLK